MRIAETVTFGASSLDRAGHLRTDEQAQARLRATGAFVPLWRGKPLVTDKDTLAWVTEGHPVLQQADTFAFLGLDDGTPRFAADISAWMPPAGIEAQGGGFFDTSTQNHPSLPEAFRFVELRGAMTRLSRRDAELAATARAVLQWHASHRFCSSCGQPSVATHAGWQRGCAACGAQHFPRTDPVVIMLITNGNRALMGRSPGWPAEMYSCLAGFVEPGETIEAAVRREVLEESGIVVGEVGYLASQPWPFPANLMIGCRGTAQSTEITLDQVELEDARWITREEMVAVMAGQHPSILPARKGAIAHFLIQNWLADRLE